ncbi:MAG: enoyl-CoA hydratase-related protein, partial [Chloroflexota bacterium]
MSDYKTLLHTFTDGVAEITLNRPEALNAFDDLMAAEFQEALKSAERDPAVRALLITGAGKGFCAGQDLGAVRERPEGLSFREHLLKTYNPIVAKLRSIEKPVVAAVNGAAVGAGF